jgi:hypothetical protein
MTLWWTLQAACSGLPERTQAAIDGRHRSQRDAFAEQPCMSLARTGVDEAFTVQHPQDRLVVFGTESACCRTRRCRRLAPPMIGIAAMPRLA